MTLVVVETVTEAPITLDRLGDEGERVFPCLTARDAQWQYSLLSSDRHRMICRFDAPDAESVRASYRKAKVDFSRIWAVEEYTAPSLAPPTSQRWVLEGLRSPMTEADWTTLHQRLLQWPQQEGQWLTACLTSDRSQLFCEFTAETATAVPKLDALVPDLLERLWLADVLTLSSFS